MFGSKVGGGQYVQKGCAGMAASVEELLARPLPPVRVLAELRKASFVDVTGLMTFNKRGDAWYRIGERLKPDDGGHWSETFEVYLVVTKELRVYLSGQRGPEVEAVLKLAAPLGPAKLFFPGFNGEGPKMLDLIRRAADPQARPLC